MLRRKLVLIFALPCLAGLAGFSDAQGAASGETPRTKGTSDDSMQSLMREAFPAWNGRSALLLLVPSHDKPNELTTIAAHPTTIVKVDDTHRALLVVGTPSDDGGHESAAHSQGGNLGVYGFTFDRGRWLKTSAQDSVLWSGSSGILGNVKVAELGPGHPAVFVEGSYTGQGQTVSWLDVVALESGGARVVLPGVRVHSDSLGWMDGCEDWLAGTRRPPQEAVAHLTPDNCFEVTGVWRIERSANDGRGDILIRFNGHRAAVDAKTGAKSVRAIAETLVYRYSRTGYLRLRGRNPAPEV